MEVVNNPHTTFLPINIRCLRRKMNVSQEGLAGRVGLNRGNIASYENGTAEPKICNLLKLSNLFGISMLDLTQKNLNDEDALNLATNNYQKISNSEKELIQQFRQQADEIFGVLKSIYTCQEFQSKALGELPKDMQMIMLNFEQLYKATQTLMRDHQDLLDFINCRIK